MNKTALKNFAIAARNELIERVELQALKIGISKDKVEEADVESSDAFVIQGKTLSDLERRQRNQLINQIEDKGYDQVIEEVAYTWFNRFVALRFMEVNDYLPTRVRVLSSESGTSSEPEMMKEALTLDLDIDKEKVYNLKMNNETDELFKYLIQLHCNDLNKYMPFMFETLEDYKMILFPEGLLGTESFVIEMIDTEKIPEEDWQQVEIIGWLYQYYITEENERVIQAKKQYQPEELPAATQLFTPDWIVKYMVQNALGRYWVESHPEQNDLIESWEFYLQNRQEDYSEKIKKHTNEDLNIEEITCFDPAMGSGHILVYMFDVLYEIYEKNGYMTREIPRLIIENNLYGLDIDERAYQLASFSVVMKALQYNKRFLRSIEQERLKINLAVIEETNDITEEELIFLAGEEEGKNYDKMQDFLTQFKDAKSIGSLIKLTTFDKDFLDERELIFNQETNDIFELEMKNDLFNLYSSLSKQAEIMNMRHDVFVTNPPYAGNRYIPNVVKDYLKDNYPDVNSDFFSSFIEYSFSVTKENGQIGFMTPYVWMFISSYEKLRNKIINDRTISSLIQLEYSGFDGATVPICTFTLRNYTSNIEGEYIRLEEFKGAKVQSIKTLEAIENPNVYYRYTFNQDNFKKVPGNSIAYWVPMKLYEVFEKSKKFLEYIDVTGSQNITANNKKYLRKVWEVSNHKIGCRWELYIKGGNYRKWYGNIEEVVDWSQKARDFYNQNKTSNLLSEKYWYKRGISYNGISSKGFSARFTKGAIYDKKGPTFHIKENDFELYFLGMLNTKVVDFILDIYNPTISYQMRDINNIPVMLPKKNLMNNISLLSEENMKISKNDWDLFETSWNFRKHALLNYKSNIIESSFINWQNDAEKQFNQLKTNEEELNSMFIRIYNLTDELTPEVKDKDVTIRKANLERDIKSFISYAIGCALGRYSLDEEGLIYAGGEFDSSRYQTFPADDNNILPILPDSYFDDDIVSLFINFVNTTYGTETLEENLTFVAEAIGKRVNESSREAIRRYFLNNFYKDHVQTYKKHPIYWQFTSGKEKAFNCLIYMHRYDKTTLSRIRTDYLHDVQARYDTVKSDLQFVIDSEASASEIRDAKKELTSVDKKIAELKEFDEKLHHMADMQIEIDLDDGVKENYQKFKGLVTKI